MKLTATHSYLKPGGDDVEVQEKWTSTEGCIACESAHGSRCEARRYESRLKCRRGPPVTTRRVYHDTERSQSNPVSDRDKEKVAPAQ